MLDEALSLIAALIPLRETLSLPDRRFLYSWRLYLRRTGDQARIGRWRIASLRQTCRANGVECEEAVVPEIAVYQDVNIG